MIVREPANDLIPASFFSSLLLASWRWGLHGKPPPPYGRHRGGFRLRLFGSAQGYGLFYSLPI